MEIPKEKSSAGTRLEPTTFQLCVLVPWIAQAAALREPFTGSR